MNKRYQVFVSSTYEDLQEERKEVMQALLELDCIPSGMELFPAANEDQWSLIKRVIDDSDYYIVIIGGRYGSIGPNGISYTEMEYRYALEKNKPIIAFLHKSPGKIASDKTESSPEGKEKLKAFCELAQHKMVKYWTSPSDLGSVVSRSIIRLIKDFPAIGWVKSDMVSSEEASQEIIRLKKDNEELKRKLEEARTKAPEGTEQLAQGDMEIEVRFRFQARNKRSYDINNCTATTSLSWNEIFNLLSPYMIDEASETDLRVILSSYIASKEKDTVAQIDTFKGLSDFKSFNIMSDDFQTIKVQLRALGLITKSAKQRSVKDTLTYWTLTPYGDNVMTRLRAIKKKRG